MPRKNRRQYQSPRYVLPRDGSTFIGTQEMEGPKWTNGVEAHLQELLAEHISTLGEGYELVRREYPTAIGPVDILARDPRGGTVAVEVKRRGGIDGVEQLSRYVELLNRDELLRPVRGVFAAQEIKPQARTLASDRGFDCVTLDYDELRGIESNELRLF